MKLIIGGAYQGKKKYAMEYYDGLPLLEEFHLMVLELVKSGIDPVEYVKSHLDEYRGMVILCDDISCGIVPVDPIERKWREELGRTLGVITQNSDEVVRVFCGLGTKLK